MKRYAWMKWLAAGMVLAVMACGGSIALAQVDKPDEGGRASLWADVDDFMTKCKRPCEWLCFGGDIRLREIFSPNLLLDQEDRHFQRYRFRLWSKITPVKDVEVNVRLVWEPRHYCEPDRVLRARDASVINSWTGSEAIFDHMNLKWSNVLGLPLTVTVGRQDIILGNGWLVLDGTPLDGSRTIFFDAARATIDLKDINTKVDLIGIRQKSDSDYWLKPFCDKDFHNMEQDEAGAIIYVSNTSLPNTQIDGYFIYKHDDQDLGSQPGDVGAGALAPWQTGATGDIYTIGGRVAGTIDQDGRWKYRVEGAHQFGHKNGRQLCAFGFNSQIRYFFKDKWNNNLRAGYEYLSGDKQSSRGRDEQFDPLWGRWPQFSELYVYPVALENRPGETTNFHRLGFGWSCKPHEKLDLAADYHLLWADRHPARNNAFFTNNGAFRGQLLTGVLKYKFNPHISGHLLAEVFMPGNFYDKARNEVAGFFRYELTFTW